MRCPQTDACSTRFIPKADPRAQNCSSGSIGAPEPFPSAEAQSLLETPLGVVVDRQNRLWAIDHGNHGTGSAQLYWRSILATGELVHEHVFDSSVAQLGSFLQDLQVDSTGEHVFIADVSFWRKNAGLVVYDVASGRTRAESLDSDPSVSAQDWLIRNPTKDMVFFGVVVLKPGVDGIAIDAQ